MDENGNGWRGSFLRWVGGVTMSIVTTLIVALVVWSFRINVEIEHNESAIGAIEARVTRIERLIEERQRELRQNPAERNR